MNRKARIVLSLSLVLLAGMALWATLTRAEAGNAPQAAGGAPPVVAYQGEVRVDGAPYSGDGHFKFAVVNAAGDTSYWSNDGSSTVGGEPSAAVPMAVSDGLFSVLLGDTTLGGMTEALAADVFSQPDRTLRVWFSAIPGGPFEQLAPDTRIAAVPYALQAQEAADADTVDGRHASELGIHYQNVVVVAKSGGDHSSVQAAIDSITDAAVDNPYLVWVAPGVYSETVMMKPYVHLQGAGQEATVISSTARSSSWPPGATVVLASDTSLRDLTVANSSATDHSSALLATTAMTRTLVADVTARAQGSADDNYAIYLTGSVVAVTLQQVTALAENGNNSTGLNNSEGAATTLRGGSFTGRGWENGYGIINSGTDTTLEAENVSALGENGSSNNYGLLNFLSAQATLRGGTFSARGGADTRGIDNFSFRTALVAESVAALAENGSETNYGLDNRDRAVATLRGGSFTGRGGNGARGIYSADSGTLLEAESVTALGENGSNGNYGLENRNGAAATLRGGSFTGRGGNGARGIYNVFNGPNGATLEAESVTALGENGSLTSHGLYNSTQATLHGGSFTGRGGPSANGIHNNASAELEATGVGALAENGSSSSYGLENRNGATATLRGGSFTGSGGASARGIYNHDATLEAESITSLGENGSGTVGMYNSGSGATANVTQSVLEGATHTVYHDDSGSVTISNSRLAGVGVTGTATCTLVTRGTTISTDGTTCP